jgi:DNA-binding transcriptional MerR regulator
MNLSISDLEQFSGVPVHTIRIWERRYNALTPMRSAGNTRFYGHDQLKKLLNIVSLNQAGLKISHVCALSEAEVNSLLQKEIDKSASKTGQFEYYIAQLLSAGLVYDELKFNDLITGCIAQNGMKETYQSVIYPILLRLGLMWRIDQICPAQEHFLTGLIRQKLMVAINDLSLKTQTKSTWLLFLPEDEVHDIGLLFASYLLRSMGHKVIFLGERVPFASVMDVIEHNKINHVLMFMVRLRPVEEANNYLNLLTEKLKNITVHLAGNTKLISSLKLGSKIKWFKSIAEFEQNVNNLSHAN